MAAMLSLILVMLSAILVMSSIRPSSAAASASAISLAFCARNSVIFCV